MAGRKRAAAEETTTEKRETRSSKVAKTEGVKSASRAAKGTARLKTHMSQSAFKSRAMAMPLHVNITTTDPVEGQEPADPGFLATTVITASSFATGSFGWKGNKRMVVEFPKAEGEEEGEKVNVQLTINATVIGSKDMKEEEEHEGEKEETAVRPTEEATGTVETKEGESPQGEGKQGEDDPPTGEEQAEESTS